MQRFSIIRLDSRVSCLMKKIGCTNYQFNILFSPTYARGNQRPNSKYRPNCWTEDPNDQPPPIPDYENENINSRRRKRQVPCLWELQEHIWGLENDDY